MNIRHGLQPILLIPSDQEGKARNFAQYEGIEKDLAIISIESFIATNIFEMATEEGKDLFSILKEIVETYNKRLSEVETDMSLLIEVR